MSALRERLHRGGSERGVSLVELIVASALLLLVLPTAGSLLHSAVLSQRDVVSINLANGTTQSVASSLEAGIRNAAAVNLTSSGAGGLDDFLVARVRTGTIGSNSFACRAWFYSASDRAIYTFNTPVTFTTTPLAPPTPSTLSGWTMLTADVTPASGGRVFAVSADQRRVDLAIVVAAGERRPATLTTSVVRRPQLQIKGAPCF